MYIGKSNTRNSDDSGSKIVVHRLKTVKNFVYEDDNTLLEFPITKFDALDNPRLNKPTSNHGCNEVKENLNPDMSCSGKNNFFNDNDGIQINNDYCKIVKRKDCDAYQDIFKRNCQIVGQFQTVKIKNNLLNNDTSENHLTNVNTNDLRFDSVRKLYFKRYNNESDTSKGLKVSIDLQKINFSSAKTNLFLNKKQFSFHKRLKVYNADVKLIVETKPGVKKFLTKAQSFDCLCNIVENENLKLNRVKCLSTSDLSQIFCKNNIKLNFIEKKVRRSQRCKTKSCVR